MSDNASTSATSQNSNYVDAGLDYIQGYVSVVLNEMNPQAGTVWDVKVGGVTTAIDVGAAYQENGVQGVMGVIAGVAAGGAATTVAIGIGAGAAGAVVAARQRAQ